MIHGQIVQKLEPLRAPAQETLLGAVFRERPREVEDFAHWHAYGYRVPNIPGRLLRGISPSEAERAFDEWPRNKTDSTQPVIQLGNSWELPDFLAAK